eukprot:7217440-Prymnesium_polylepis.1
MTTKPYPPHSTIVCASINLFASRSCSPPPSCTLMSERPRIRLRNARISASVRSAMSASDSFESITERIASSVIATIENMPHCTSRRVRNRCTFEYFASSRMHSEQVDWRIERPDEARYHRVRVRPRPEADDVDDSHVVTRIERGHHHSRERDVAHGLSASPAQRFGRLGEIPAGIIGEHIRERPLLRRLFRERNGWRAFECAKGRRLSLLLQEIGRDHGSSGGSQRRPLHDPAKRATIAQWLQGQAGRRAAVAQRLEGQAGGRQQRSSHAVARYDATTPDLAATRVPGTWLGA